MKIEIVGIGDEILAGMTINTNASYISAQLAQEGFQISSHSVYPDSREQLKKGLQDSLARSQLVITTGGLGPTCDDNTRKIAAELFDSDFIFNEEIAAELEKRYGPQLTSLADQATVPRKGLILKNEVGTAPGFIFTNEANTLILLPGPPFEMRLMLSKHVLPYLQKHFLNRPKNFRKSIHLFNLVESAVDPLLRELKMKYPEVEFGIYSSYGLLNVHLTYLSTNENEALAHLTPPHREISEAFSKNIFESHSGRIEEAVHQRFIEKQLTLSVAESCTGGSLTARLTRLPNASKYFIGAVVPYSNEMKTKILGVPESLLLEKGAVSPEVVEQMLAGVLKLCGSDFAAAVSGIAGPSGGTPEKPVGTVWCGIGRQNAPMHIWRIKGYGSREMIIERSVNALLSELLIQSN